MKKIGFIMQVLTLSAALPLLTYLELGQKNANTIEQRKALEYVLNPVDNATKSFTSLLIAEGIKKSTETKPTAWKSKSEKTFATGG